MKFLADESVDMPVYQHLKNIGFDIQHISLVSKGSTEVDVLNIFFSQKRILPTVDKDFGDLAFINKKPAIGNPKGLVLQKLCGICFCRGRS